MNIPVTIFLGALLLAFLLFLYAFIGSRYLYHAQLLYHYWFEREDYDHFKAALRQIKEHGTISLLPVSWWVQSNIIKKYRIGGEYEYTYHLLAVNGHIALYLGENVVITNFGNLLIKKLVKAANISDKNVQLLNLIEKRSNELGYPSFMAKYFGSDWHQKNITYKEFLTTFVEKDENCKLIKKGE